MQTKGKVSLQIKPRKVFIALDLSENAGRRILSGILRFANSGRRWQLTVANDFRRIDSGFVQRTLCADFDGVIGGLPELAGGFAELLALPVPFVLNVTPERLPVPASAMRRTVFVDVDNAAIGRAAFEYLSNRGNFRAAAFISDRADRKWSADREKAFVRGWKSRGVTIRALKFATGDRPYDQTALDGFLQSLPKPAAVWCVYDTTAVSVLEACARCEIKVPDQIAILSTDNDEPLCKYASPSLSSIELPQEREGYLAAQALDRLMSGRRPPQKTILTGGDSLKIVERDSSRRIPPAAHLITAAQDFIAAHADSGISVPDVAKHLGISRPLLDLRFRQILNKSVGRAIQDARLGEIKRRLRYTDASMSQIAARCSFSSLPRLAHFFKRETGLSMREYRQRTAKGLEMP